MRYFAAALIVLSLAACDTTDPVATPSTIATTIEAAEVYVGGTPVGGGMVSGEQGQSLFQVRLRDRDRIHLNSVEQCAVGFDLPGQGQMHQRRTGEQLCYDDGTNGDDTPGDGLYHWADTGDAMGCGRGGSPNGAYQYRFRCVFDDGSESEMDVTVTRQ